METSTIICVQPTMACKILEFKLKSNFETYELKIIHMQDNFFEKRMRSLINHHNFNFWITNTHD